MSDVIVVDEQTLVVNSSVTSEILEIPEQTVIHEVTEVPSVVEIPNTTEVVTQNNTSEIIEVGEQVLIETAGQQGPIGPPGPSGSPYLALLADGPLSGQRVARSTTSGKAGYADSATPAHANSVLGITTGAAADSADIFIQTGGLMTDPTFFWTVDQPVFCGLNGALTQVAPIAGFSLIVGVATSPTSLAIDIKQPINLS